MARMPLSHIAVVAIVILVAGCSKSSKGPTAPPQPGDVVVTGSPLGVMLSVDGTQVGVTPQTVTGLAAGSHTFTLAGFEGYADTVVTTSVASGASDSLVIDVRPLPGTPAQIETWDMPFIGGGLRETPFAIDATQGGAIWVAGVTGTIYRYDANGTPITQWATTGMGGGAEIAASDTRVVYASSDGQSVGLFTLTGTLIHSLSSTPTNALNEWQPIPHPAVDEYATDAIFCPVAGGIAPAVQVQRYAESDGHYMSRWVLHADATISQPGGRFAVCDEAHNVFVRVSGNGQSALDKYAADGTFLQRWSPFVDAEFDLGPGGVVYAYTPGSSFITRTTLSTGATHRWQITGGRVQTICSGVAVNPDGVYVVDSANRRIIRYVLE